MRRVQRAEVPIVTVAALIVIILAPGSRVTAQKTTRFEYRSAEIISKSEARPLDLTELAKRNCDASIRKQLGNTFIELRFPSKFERDSRNAFDLLERSVVATRAILFPLKTASVRFYLIQLPTVPASYRMSDSANEDFYLHLWAFSDPAELNLDCTREGTLCSGIVRTVPHELTHLALEDSVGSKGTRWFHEGFAGYVANRVSRIFCNVSENEIMRQNIQRTALNRPDLRESLFTWKYSDKVGRDARSIRKEWLSYIASEYLITLIVTGVGKNGGGDPKETFLNALLAYKKNNGSAIESQELTDLIEAEFQTDLHKLGFLTTQEQYELVNNALKRIQSPNMSDNRIGYALFVLANLDEIPLTTGSLELLVQIVLSKSINDDMKSLAATALKVRASQPNYVLARSNATRSYAPSEVKPKALQKKIETLSFR